MTMDPDLEAMREYWQAYWRRLQTDPRRRDYGIE